MKKTRTLLLFAALLAGLAACHDDNIIPTPGPDDPDSGKGEPTSYYAYALAQIDITTDGGVAVDSKESEDYRPCTVKIDGNDFFSDLEARGKIRGRGNSTWDWYPKKPYRIKLDESQPVLGMKKNRDWVLLADYRDVTHMMNNVGFTLAHELGIPSTNHSRYATVTLNGEYLGLYMVTEQVEEGGHRVKLDSNEGLLLALDINDGPGDEPYATNNFWSEGFGMAVAVKYPDDATEEQRDRAKAEFAALEEAIDNLDWEKIQSLLDVESMINYILVQEIICNVELDNNPSLRSGYIHRYDDSSKWVMGPVWDCDGGFDYNWGDMYDSWGMGHTFFESYRDLIFGSDPFNHRGAYGSTASDFFCRLFGIPEFVEMLQQKWDSIIDTLPDTLEEHLASTEEVIGDAAQDDMDLWGITNYTHTREFLNLINWLSQRFSYLDQVVRNYPTERGTVPDKPYSGEVTIKTTIEKSVEFAQDGHYTGVTVPLTDSEKEQIAQALGLGSFEEIAMLYFEEELSFQGIEPDGSLNPNNTANAPGHWFDNSGRIVSHNSNSYVFSEFDLWECAFKVGKHPTIATPGEYGTAQAFVYGANAAAVKFHITITE